MSGNFGKVKIDKRGLPRRRMLKQASVRLGRLSASCVLLDLSETGARLYVKDGQLVPERVTLELFDGRSYRAHLRWRDGNQCGFAFEGG